MLRQWLNRILGFAGISFVENTGSGYFGICTPANKAQFSNGSLVFDDQQPNGPSLWQGGNSYALFSAAFVTKADSVGTGSSQDIPHGFGHVPYFAMAIPVGTGVPSDIVEGTHDATNLKFTVTNTVPYVVIAFG